jgi:hypothetical protein
VPILSPTLILTVLDTPASAVAAQITLVTVYHEAVKHLCVLDGPTTPITTVGVGSLMPKFSPCKLTDAPPLVGPFWYRKYDTIGPAYVKVFCKLPICSSNAILTGTLFPKPAGPPQTIEVEVTQVETSQTDSPSKADGWKLLYPKLVPDRVTLNPPDGFP